MTDAWSIADGYWDTSGEWHATPPETRTALLRAMGAEGREQPPDGPPMWFVEAGDAQQLASACHLTLEDGTTLPALEALPPDVPLGYHSLVPADEGPATTLVVTPHRCPRATRAWGWAAQLYALRSSSSWGHGDLGDLAELARWTASLGGGVVMVNPLHASHPGVPQQPSPYFATSRIWRSVLYLRVADIPGATGAGLELAALDDAGRALGGDRINRDAVYDLKQQALRALYERWRARPDDAPGFVAWRDQQGASLERFAVWCALAARHGPDSTAWPAALRHPAAAGVKSFATEHGEDVTYFAWCQWQLDRQLQRASRAGAGLIHDVAVGFDPRGADGWAFQDVLATGCRVGAPPDTFNQLGQDWGLPPFVPWKLRAAHYEPFIATIRAAFTHAAGIRIDHVMGLFRLYWIPPDGGPRDGAYVQYRAQELLDLVALEAHRAGAFVVGEDLGTVEDEVREELAEREILSYKLVWFEEGPTSTMPEGALAAATTHDLATIAGVWTGDDVAVRTRLGVLPPGTEPVEPFHDRIVELTGLPDGAPVDQAIAGVYDALADAPCRVLLGTLEDATATTLRPNHPGTIDEWPNWRIPLPVSLEELEHAPLALRIAATLDEGTRRPATHEDEGEVEA